MSNRSQMYSAHVVVFGYKRPQHLQTALECLEAAEGASETSVTIFIDGPKNDAEMDLIHATRNIAEKRYKFANKDVICSENNQGLATSITRGVSTILESKDQIIVLEDDILVGYGFLRFMNDALYRYNTSSEVFSISGYVAPEVGIEIEKGVVSAGFAPRTSSWGWATWRRAWQDAKWFDQHLLEAIDKAVWPINSCGNDIQNMLKLQSKGLIDSWAALWAAFHFINGGLCLYPSKSYVENIGMDGSGTHCRATNHYATCTDGIEGDMTWPIDLTVTPEILKAFQHVYNRSLGSHIKWPVLRLLKWLRIRK